MLFTKKLPKNKVISPILIDKWEFFKIDSTEYNHFNDDIIIDEKELPADIVWGECNKFIHEGLIIPKELIITHPSTNYPIYKKVYKKKRWHKGFISYKKIPENRNTPYTQEELDIYAIDRNFKEITIFYNYPLNLPTYRTHYNKDGFTLQNIVDVIRSDYRNIFEIENATSTIESQTIKQATNGQSSLVNRCRTNGQYCIWGHFINQLWLEGLIYDHKNYRFIPLMGS